MPVLAPGTGKTKTGRLWTYVRDERPFAGSRPPAALFFYSPDRKGEHPQAHLKDFRGVIHADGYAGFNGLFAGKRIIEAACWAHVRRKFFDVHAATGSPIAKEALDRIGHSTRSRRRSRFAARPATTANASCVEANRRGTGRLGRADRAPALPQIRARPGLPLHAGALEGTVAMLRRRPPRPRQQPRRARAALRRDRPQELLIRRLRCRRRRAAALYSLIESAKLNGLNPQHYLADVLARIADHPARRIAELLPWNWQARQHLTAPPPEPAPSPSAYVPRQDETLMPFTFSAAMTVPEVIEVASAIEQTPL